jgi:hypothetical protein
VRKVAQWFMRVDPLAAKRSWVSPYNYVQNNPILRVDPTGALDDWYRNADGNIVYDEKIRSQVDLDSRGIQGTYLGESYADVRNVNFFGYTISGIVVYENNGETTPHVQNEFGLVSLLSLGSDHISNNQGAEDTYSFIQLDNTRSETGQHGDDWMTPEAAAGFYNAAEQLSRYFRDVDIVFNDASAYNPRHNLGHSSAGGHSRGEAFDIRFLRWNGTSTNNIHNLNFWDKALNGAFVFLLRENGFNTFYSHNGLIGGTAHARGHRDHLHGER